MLYLKIEFMNRTDFVHADNDAMLGIAMLTVMQCRLNAGSPGQLDLFFLSSLRYLRMLLFWIKSQLVLLVKASFIKDLQCCFQEIILSCKFFMFILYFIWTIFPNKYFQKRELSKKYKKGTWPYRWLPLEEGGSKLLHTMS